MTTHIVSVDTNVASLKEVKHNLEKIGIKVNKVLNILEMLYCSMPDNLVDKAKKVAGVIIVSENSKVTLIQNK